MGYTIKQKIEICLYSDANPSLTQIDLANWAMHNYGSANPPSQTTISRILSSKNEILGSKESEFSLVRRRKVSNPLLRLVLTEWMTQAHWERIPVTTPIIQSTANAIWKKLSAKDKDGKGTFSHKWCNHFVRKLNVNLAGSPAAISHNAGYPLNKVWGLDEKVGLKRYVHALISKHNYMPKDMFTIDEFSLFYCVPLDQIFDVSSVDKGLSQTSNQSDYIITVMLGCNMDGSEKLNPLVVSKHDTFDLSESTVSTFHNNPSYAHLSSHTLANKVSEAYQITYKYNNNKWITSSTFQDYLLTIDHKLESVSPDRNIVIFLDDSSTHRLMNLEFKHIRLVYLENASKHNNPFNGLFNEMKFDFIPTSFGIVEEFKIVFRLQQYLEMINKQNNQVRGESSFSPAPNNSASKANEPGEILSERDYQVPFIKAIEWIKRSWDSISKQKIYQSWKKANIIDVSTPWPVLDPNLRREAAESFQSVTLTMPTYDSQLAYNKLKNVMSYLNVVIPWEVNELLGLVNERAKVSLNYASIDEMINSCASSIRMDDSSEKIERVSEEPVKSEINNVSATPWQPSVPTMVPESFTPIPSSSPVPPSNPDLQTSRHSSQGPPQYLSSFQDKLPPILVAPSGSQSGRIGSGKYSLKDNRTSTMEALLLATTNATNDTISQTTDMSNPSRYVQDFSPNVFTRTSSNLEYDESIAKSETPPFEEQPRKRLRPMTNETFDGPIPGISIDEQPIMAQDPITRDGYRHPYSLLNGSSMSPKLQMESDAIQEEDLIPVLRKVIDASGNNGLKLSNFALEELKFNLSRIQSKSTRSWNGPEA